MTKRKRETDREKDRERDTSSSFKFYKCNEKNFFKLVLNFWAISLLFTRSGVMRSSLIVSRNPHGILFQKLFVLV